MMSNLTNADLSKSILDFLNTLNVQHVVLCAGARNAPIVFELENHKFNKTYFFEERSAAFFALGLIKSSGAPVAVITTSGTAAAELLPATIEAYYQGLPLILITADRPKSYRGSGAPQAIEQVGIFSHYVESCLDIDVKTQDVVANWSLKKPLHLNICFDEPLLTQHTGQQLKITAKPALNSSNLATTDLTKYKNPLIILSGIDSEKKASVKDFLLKMKSPIWAEATSQLKTDADLQKYLIQSNDSTVKKLFDQKICDSVIRIGGVPTLRFWRDLEFDYKNIPVLSYTNQPFTGLARNSEIKNLDSLASEQFTTISSDSYRQIDDQLSQQKQMLLSEYKNSEPSLVNQISKVIAENPIYIGNSLPIRYWDNFGEVKSKAVMANRGANGIDGQISTYLGWSEQFENSYCVLGDLTAMYDLAALGLTAYLKKQKRNIVIINNSGGQIFNRIFKKAAFINQHDVQFKSWAEQWGWNYTKITTAESLAAAFDIKNNQLNNIIEVIPDPEQTQSFLNQWDSACQKA